MLLTHYLPQTCRRLSSVFAVIFVAVFFLTSVHAHAKNENLSYEKCISNIDHALHDLREIDAWIETVPADKNDYFANEASSASRLHSTDAETSNARFGKLQQLPYFYAWQFHNDLEAVTGDLEEAKKLASLGYGKDTILFSSLAFSRLVGLPSDFSDYVNDRRNTISEKLAFDGAERLTGEIPIAMQKALVCIADKISQPEK